MKKGRFSEELIIGFLKQAEAGMVIKELCRKDVFSDAGVPLRATSARQDSLRYWHDRPDVKATPLD